MAETKYVFNVKETETYRFPTHTNELVIDRSEATASEVFVVVIEPDKGPPLHTHDDAEQIFYVLSGEGVLEIGENNKKLHIGPGDVVRVPPSTPHRVTCAGKEPLRYIAIDCFVAGKPDDEPTWASHVRVVCRQNGWDFDQVVGQK